MPPSSEMTLEEGIVQYVPMKLKLTSLSKARKLSLLMMCFYTGRSIRAALDAMNAFGRAEKVELLSLVVRKYAKTRPYFS